MIVRTRKFRVNKPIFIEDEFEITTMTGMPGMVINTDEDYKVTVYPVGNGKDKSLVKGSEVVINKGDPIKFEGFPGISPDTVLYAVKDMVEGRLVLVDHKPL